MLDMRRRLIALGILLAAVILIGTVGYFVIGGARYSWVDALYMTIITIATIGYGEIIPLEGNPGARIFTMVISVVGIGLLAYGMTTLAALVVEGELTRSFRRSRMEKLARGYRGHYIVCGTGPVGRQIAHELQDTKRHYVLVTGLDSSSKEPKDAVSITGDPTDSETLRRAGAAEAEGLFAAAGDDNVNLVISLTAKSINPKLRVLSECCDMKNADKIKQAGADGVVSPSFIGAMRMASEMVRPTVVSFLDVMLRDTGKSLRVEEVELSHSWAGKEKGSLDFGRFPSTMLLAVKGADGWVYNPPSGYLFQLKDTLVVMTTPEEREKLESEFGAC
jgi:voltage-gated potassium channel